MNEVKRKDNWQPDWTKAKKSMSNLTKSFKEPSELWAAACDYFNHMQNTPAIKKEFVKTGPFAGTEVEVEMPRPFSWASLNTYMTVKGITTSLYRYRYNDGEAYSDFQEVIKLIDDVMFSQKFEGAAVGLFKENIIAREIGLADRNNNTISIDQPLFDL